jgi:arylsulfatase A-like enzyme
MLVSMFSALLGFLPAALTGLPAQEPAADPPRLAVIVVVDQMRADYLDRFRDRFSSGFVRLLAGGAVFTDAHHDHAGTTTAAGHAALVTGAFPGRNGIVGNDWWDRAASRSVYAAEDARSPLIGFPDEAGRSPANLERTGLADWLKAAQPAARVYAVAGKDRSAITMGGRRPDGAFWFLPAAGRATTSAYYGDHLPAWLETFNALDRPRTLFGTWWGRTLPDDAYPAARAGDADGRRPFPRRLGQAFSTPDARYLERDFRYTPFADSLTLALAAVVLEREALGRDATPDLLLIGASSADHIGHAHGPSSAHVLDYYARLDRYLGALFDALDAAAGAGRWLVVVTSDHGVMDMPEVPRRGGQPGARLWAPDLLGTAQHAVDSAAHAFGLAPLRVRRVGHGFSLEPRDGLAGETLGRLRAVLARTLRAHPAIADAYTYEELRDPWVPSRPFLEAYRRSFHPARASDVVVRTREDVLLTDSRTETSHGSPYRYDTHVPLIFLGAGIHAGTYPGRVRTVDVAPTLARLLRVPAPGDLDGVALEVGPPR